MARTAYMYINENGDMWVESPDGKTILSPDFDEEPPEFYLRVQAYTQKHGWSLEENGIIRHRFPVVIKGWERCAVVVRRMKNGTETGQRPYFIRYDHPTRSLSCLIHQGGAESRYRLIMVSDDEYHEDEGSLIMVLGRIHERIREEGVRKYL